MWNEPHVPSSCCHFKCLPNIIRPNTILSQVETAPCAGVEHDKKSATAVSLSHKLPAPDVRLGESRCDLALTRRARARIALNLESSSPASVKAMTIFSCVWASDSTPSSGFSLRSNVVRTSDSPTLLHNAACTACLAHRLSSGSAYCASAHPMLWYSFLNAARSGSPFRLDPGQNASSKEGRGIFVRRRPSS